MRAVLSRFRYWPYGLLALISLVPLHWFQPGKIVDAIDMGLPFRAARLLNEYSFAWDPKLLAGTDLSQLDSLLFPYYAFFAVMEHAFGVLVAQRAEFVILFALMLLMAYKAAKELRFDSGPSLLVSLLYAFNFFVMTGFHEGFMLIILGYAFLPLNVILLRRVILGERPYRNGVFFCLVSIFYASAGSAVVTIFVTVVVPAAVCAVVYTSRMQWRSTLLRLALVTVGYAAINAFWIVPLLIAGVGIGRHKLAIDLTTWPTYVAPLSVFDNLRMLNWDVYKDSIPGTPYWTSRAYYASNFVVIAATGILALLPLWLFFIRRTREQSTASALYVVGLVGSLGFGPPFGGLFTWAVTSVPGFFIFRSTNIHFGALEAFGAAFAIGWAAQAIPIAFRVRAIVAAALLVVIATGPAWTGNIMEPARGQAPSYNWAIPAQYTELDNSLRTMSSGQRVAILPQQYEVYAGYKWGDSGAWTEDPILYWLTHPFITWPPVTNNRSAESSSYDMLTRTLNAIDYGDSPARAATGLWALNVPEVVYRTDIDKNLYAFSPMEAELGLLARLKFLKEMAPIGPLRRFHVSLRLAPHFYLSNRIISAAADTMPVGVTQSGPQPVFLQYGDLSIASALVQRASPANLGYDSIAAWELSLQGARLRLQKASNGAYEARLPFTGYYRFTGDGDNSLNGLTLAADEITAKGTVERPLHSLAFDTSGAYFYGYAGEVIKATFMIANVQPLSTYGIQFVPQYGRLSTVPANYDQVTAGRGLASFALSAGDYRVSYAGTAPSVTGTDGTPIALRYFADGLAGFKLNAASNVSVSSTKPYRIFVGSTKAPTPSCAQAVQVVNASAWRYTLRLPACASVAVLTFSESFDPGWTLRGVAAARHITANAYANGWILPAHNGSEQVSLIYIPQIAMTAGFLASIIAFVLAIGLLVHAVLRSA